MSGEALLTSLGGFFALLRRLGVRAGTAEAVDAMAALDHIDMLDRGQVAAALAAALVKDRSQYPVFVAAFDAYFSSVTPPGTDDVAVEPADDPGAERLEVQGRPLDVEPQLREVYRSLDDDDRRRVDEFLDRTSQGRNVGPMHDRLISKLVTGHLRRLRDLRQRDPVPAMGVEATGDPETDRLLGQITDRLAREDGLPLAYRDLGAIDPADRSTVIALVRRLARRLAAGLSRRYRLSSRRRRLDIRRTIRLNLRYGGVPLRLKYRRRDDRRPRLVVLADVSGSMTRYSEFVLMFVHGLSRSVSSAGVFSFSEDLAPVTLHPGADMPSLSAALARASSLHGPTTNLARSLHTLLSRYGRRLTARTVLIIVSDTKTQAVSESAAALAMVKKRVKSILWLNTVSASRWAEMPAVAEFSRHCEMKECYTLAHLDSILRSTLRAV